ncbi:MAG: hypothetical protein FJX77_11380 [Armatimonadetes bacterium]|nr:hypothetical protein [Armatimonadota bacterium]
MHNPGYGAVDQEVPLGAEVTALGIRSGRATVQLFRAGRLVESQTVSVREAQPTPVRFLVRETKPGLVRYTLAIPVQPGERTDANNRTTVFLQVMESRARVLVLEGRPTWDVKFLLQALHADPGLEVDALFQLTQDKLFAIQGRARPKPDAPSGAKPELRAPTTVAELSRYQVVMVGRGFEEFYDAKTIEVLKEYVGKQAGNLVFLRGSPSERLDALRALEPVRWSPGQIRDFRLKVTEAGAAHPAFDFGRGLPPDTVVQKLPGLISATRVEEESALSVVLARATGVAAGQPAGGNEMAVVAYHNYGQGRVVSLVGQGLWRWAFLPPALKEYAGCYASFWTQLVRWLILQSDFLPGRDVTLQADRGSYAVGDTVRLTAIRRGAGRSALPPVQVTGPDGTVTAVPLTEAAARQPAGAPEWTGTVRARQAGEHIATLTLAGSPAARIVTPFQVHTGREENLFTAADPDQMLRIAQAGGGELLSLGELPALPERLREAQTLLRSRTAVQPAWDQGWVLAALLCLLSSEWLLRRRWGLS